MEAVINIPIAAVLAGRVKPFGPKGVPSGIEKTVVSGSVRITKLGLDIDEQGDPKHHGGPEKALHHYPRDHYPVWHDTLAAHGGNVDVLDAPGAFGENFSTHGLTEAEVCIGDRFRVGTALVEVSQARQPCWKLNHRFGYAAMSRSVQERGRTGWYYRVIEEGEVSAGDRMVLVARPYPQWTLQRLLHVLYVDRLNDTALAEMADLAPLAESWRKLARQRVASHVVEDMEKRLAGG
ncbi:MOSC domain-containing protein [Cupriavidus metallidurans]|uniref:MOSC domain-containing protein n=1 Tax=Cupriavidus metallidurans TaxID=119219 RepID=UPI001CCABCC1|nr:MOSC domain-containing protein [Cupriavidus metallidurans]UBM12366.1 MOSC domain-containing protein [Cupriavidus metallidurans]